MELINGKALQRGADLSQVNANEALAGKQLVCFYFSAHWCPPCRQFTPILKDFYEVRTTAFFVDLGLYQGLVLRFVQQGTLALYTQFLRVFCDIFDKIMAIIHFSFSLLFRRFLTTLR